MVILLSKKKITSLGMSLLQAIASLEPTQIDWRRWALLFLIRSPTRGAQTSL